MAWAGAISFVAEVRTNPAPRQFVACFWEWERNHFSNSLELT
jgi:hypothetical protein